MRVRALRGAITIESDTREEVIRSTVELLEEMLNRNDVAADDIIYILFSATDDIRSEFPAASVRRLGLGQVPVMCAKELAINDSLPLAIRAMMVLYTDRAREQLRHVYLRDARQLRTDLPE